MGWLSSVDFMVRFDHVLLFLLLTSVWFGCHLNPLSANLTKWSNTLKQSVVFCRRIVGVCLTNLWDWCSVNLQHVLLFNRFRPRVGYCIETKNLFCKAKKMTGFCMKCNTRFILEFLKVRFPVTSIQHLCSAEIDIGWWVPVLLYGPKLGL